MVEFLLPKQAVAGSNPVSRSTVFESDTPTEIPGSWWALLRGLRYGFLEDVEAATAAGVHGE